MMASSPQSLKLQARHSTHCSNSDVPRTSRDSQAVPVRLPTLQRSRSKSSRARPFPALRSLGREARDGRMLYSPLSLADAVPASRAARSNVSDKGNSVQCGSVASRASFDGSPIANSPLRNRFIALCGTARRRVASPRPTGCCGPAGRCLARFAVRLRPRTRLDQIPVWNARWDRPTASPIGPSAAELAGLQLAEERQ